MQRSALTALIAACLFTVGLLVRGDDKTTDSAAMLDRVRTMEDLRTEGEGPLVLRAHIQTANDNGPIDGTYSLTWFAPNRWHEELRLGSFIRVRDGVDGGYRQICSVDFQPQVIFDLDRLLDPVALARVGPKEAAGKTRKRKINSVEMWCVEIRGKEYRDRALCFDPPTGLLLHAEFGSGGGDKIDYTGAWTLKAKRFPMQMKSQGPGEFSVNVSVDVLGVPTGEAASLPVADPARSEFWRSCKDAVPAKPADLTQTVQPIYPQESKRRHEQGMVLLYARVESDGRVSHLRALSAPSVALAQASLDAVAHWKYTPQMCGSTPVTSETTIRIVFTIGG